MKRYRTWSKYHIPHIPARQDNKTYYSNGWAIRDDISTPEFQSLRIPSLKRGKSTWKRFYRLFPHLKGLDEFRGCPLKKI